VGIESLLENGVRFGQGLQLINILRDLPADLRMGRCYLPWPALQLLNLKPRDLLNPANEQAFRPAYDEWLAIADGHLRAGWRYVLDLPFRWPRVRLACAWPILIGRKTLELLRAGPVLNPDTRLKISRADVRAIIGKTTLSYPFPSTWRELAPGTPDQSARKRTL
jgi:farnesyl-diphosphate farnesyltransferase